MHSSDWLYEQFHQIGPRKWHPVSGRNFAPLAGGSSWCYIKAGCNSEWHLYLCWLSSCLCSLTKHCLWFSGHYVHKFCLQWPVTWEWSFPSTQEIVKIMPSSEINQVLWTYIDLWFCHWILSETEIIWMCHCVLGKVEPGFWGKKTGFQGDRENLQQNQPQYFNKNIVCISKQSRIWPTKMINRKIQG